MHRQDNIGRAEVTHGEQLMRFRKLGNTDVDVGIIGLGLEHLENASAEVVDSVIGVALEQGVNYLDLFMASPDIRDKTGNAIKGKRHTVMIAGHLGAAFINGQYCKVRDVDRSEFFFEDLLTRLDTDYIDVLMLHFVDEQDDLEKVFGAGNLLDLATRLKKDGKVRSIGMSAHMAPTAATAVKSGCLDVIMFPVNAAFDMLPGTTQLDDLLEDSTYQVLPQERTRKPTDRTELYRQCLAEGVGIIAMKPYAGGRLLRKENGMSFALTPVQALHYCLSQPGVSVALPGCRTPDEMKAALAYLEAGEGEKDFSIIRDHPLWAIEGNCVYCNHCLPCPVSIDIGRVTQLMESEGETPSERIRAEYDSLSSPASACIQCSDCEQRCPFKVEVIKNMEKAVRLFGA